MLKRPKLNNSNIVSFIIILILLIPQTRKPIQVQVQKLIALIPPSIEFKSERQQIKNLNWQLKSLNNKVLNLGETSNRVKVVGFWATWCPPCIAEMPSIQKLYADYSDKVDFVMISNENLSKLRAFIDENDYTFPVYTPLEQTKEIYFNPRTIPRTLLIDKKNEIIIIEDGASNWNSSKVRETLDKLINNQIVY